MKLLLPIFAVIGAIAAQQVCKPAIEKDSIGIYYDRLVSRFIKAKQELDHIEDNASAVAQVEEIILNHSDNGLDEVMEKIRSLGLELYVASP